jgi:sterol desaturase/sphingolipid hydroxylase (fatty acid hydroxylase superfamily)
MEYQAIRDIKPKHSGQGKVFTNPLLEKLTKSHAAIPISMLVGFAIGFIYWGTQVSTLSVFQYIWLVLSGLFVWSFFEYIMHRHLYHMLPTNQLKGWIQYNMHGVHHEYPKDKTRLAMPPVMMIIISFLFIYIFRFIIGDYAFGFTPGFLLGYTSYLCVHYIIHAYQPPKNIFKALWINHGVHHYKDPDAAFGVSSPLWDYVFGTMPKKNQ